MREDSLRAQGGDDREFEIHDPILRDKVIRFLDYIPANQAASVAIEANNTLEPALQYLIDNNLLTRRQYNIMAESLAGRGENYPKQGLLKTIVDRVSSERVKIYEALGWNKYPTDDDPTMDVIA